MNINLSKELELVLTKNKALEFFLWNIQNNHYWGPLIGELSSVNTFSWSRAREGSMYWSALDNLVEEYTIEQYRNEYTIERNRRLPNQ